MQRYQEIKWAKWGGAGLITLLLLGKLSSREVFALEYSLGDVGVKITGAMTAGTTIRTSPRDSSLYPANNGSVINVGGSAVSGSNSDDGNLNFDKYDRVSTVAKGILGVEAKYSLFKAFVRGKAWYDYTLENENMPWGNVQNNYTPNTPLGDEGVPSRSKFQGIALMEAYLEGNFKPSEVNPVDIRVGNQLIPWGGDVAIPGGLSLINPVDIPATRRPGALPEETRIPFPAAYAKIGLTKDLKVEGYYQLQYQPTEIDVCGTFYSNNDYIGQGCNKVFAGAGSDRTRVVSGSYIKKAGTPDVSNSGQFGVGLTYKAAPINTDFGAYYSQFHNRTPFASIVKSSRATPFIPNDPGGLNVQYFAEYPEEIQMYAVNFKSKVNDSTIYGEVSYRPNQPLSLNASDLLNAFVSNSAASTLRADATATPSGGVFNGYDRQKVAQAQVGLVQKFKDFLGADSGSVGSEIALKHVFELPDVNVRRYGRSDAFGTGPVNGVCAAGANSVQCSNDGYVTSNAWGYRLNASLLYKNVVNGLDLLPSMRFGHDVSGWSYDNVFNEGRMTMNMALRANVFDKYMAEIAYNPTWGGTYNNTRDRGSMSVFAGFKF